GFDPATITGTNVTTSGATISVTYEWERSTNNGSTWTAIAGATGVNYNPPALNTTTLFRRRAFNNNGCGNDVSNVVTVTITPDPSISITAPITEGCVGGTRFDLVATTAGGIGCTITWQRRFENQAWTDFASGSTTQNAGTGTNWNGDQAGTYQYRARYTCTGGGCNDITSNVVSVERYPNPSVSITSDGTQRCVGSVVNFTATAVNGSGCSYQWQRRIQGGSWADFGNNSATAASSTGFNGNTAGTYQFRVLYNCAGNGCSNATSNVINVDFVADPTVNISTTSAATVCLGETISFTSSTDGGLNCSRQWQYRAVGGTWINAGIGAPNFNLTNSHTTTAGDYQVRLQYNCAGDNCGNVNSNIIDVTINPLPDLICEYRINGTGGWNQGDCTADVFIGNRLELAVNPNNLSSYIWTGPNGFSGNGDSGGAVLVNNSINDSHAGVYTVVATDANGCMATTEVTVNVYEMQLSLNETCNDNGTTGDPSDDYSIITVSATSELPGSSNQFEVLANGAVIGTGTYGTPLDLEWRNAASTQRFIADDLATYTLTIRDRDLTYATQQATTNPVAPCSACDLSIVSITPTDCLNGQFDLEVVVNYQDIPTANLEINGQLFPIADPTATAGQSALETFVLTNLPCTDTENRTVTVNVPGDNSCGDQRNYAAPGTCLLVIDEIVTSECAIDRYSVDVTVTYENAPGSIEMNGQQFMPASTSGTETFTLLNLDCATTNDQTINVRFTDNNQCSENTTITAPCPQPRICIPYRVIINE
ncbi:MAG: hypothetical protein AB8G22_11530, partial [Saprospiraceae bacterium]